MGRMYVVKVYKGGRLVNICGDRVLYGMFCIV